MPVCDQTPGPSDEGDITLNQNDIDDLNKLRAKNIQNPFFAYYNINSLRFKFDDLKEIISKSLPDILVFAETKLDSSFSNAQFFLEEYYEPTRKDKSCHSGGIIEFIRKGIIRKRLIDFELKHFESIASELTINKNKFFLLSFYRTERDENKLQNIIMFFQELSLILENVTNKYDNIILMGDINIDFHDKKCIGFKELGGFMDIFNLTNLIKDKTCFFRDHQSSIDVLLTNKPRRFFNSYTFELGVSDCHKMIGTNLRAHVARLNTKIIRYRSMKNFKKEDFLNELTIHLNDFTCDDTNTAYDKLLNILTNVLDKHAPIKIKKVRGNQSRFMNRNLSKAIMKRSYLKSKYFKNKSNTNRANYKKQRNLCVKLRDEAITNDFQKSTSNLKSNSKPFYDLIKPYMTNKGALCSTDINLIENGKIISDESALADIFIDYYTNIVKYSSGKNPTSIADSLGTAASYDVIIDTILDIHKDHPSIICIQSKRTHSELFKFQNVNENGILKLLKSVETKKAIGIDGLPALIVKYSANILAKPLTDIINLSICENTFPSKAKIAAVLPLFKKDDRSQKKNYRPISILSTLSKVIGKVLQNQIVTYNDHFLSPYISAYRKAHSTQHVLIRLIEEWKSGLDNGNFVGGVLMDLSKAFDCIPHDLLIAKLSAYGFEKPALKYIYSYLKGRRQCVRINGTQSKFLTILAGVPQGSILGPILFNIFINDFNYIFTAANLHGFADDHTLSAKSESLEIVKNTLCNESFIALKWLNDNQMLANPSKFQTIFLTKNKDHIQLNLQIDNQTIESKKSVQLLGIEIDDKLKFESHVKDLCRKAAGQLNSLYRFKKYLPSFSKKLAITSFIFSNFNYCPLVRIFSSATTRNKIEQIQNRALNFLNYNSDSGLIFTPGNSTMEVKRLRVLAVEIFKTLHNLNPAYMKNIFHRSINRTSERFKFNIQTQRFNQVKFGRNSLRVIGPILWNSLPNNVKSLQSLPQFKKFINSWGNFGCPHYEKFQSYYTAIK